MLALTLSRRDFRENDGQVSLYIRENGKIMAVARGIKKIIAKNASALEPFALLEIDLAAGRGLTYVTRAQVVESFGGIRTDSMKILIGSYCINLVDELTQPGEKDEKIFDLLYQFLKHADTAAEINNSTAYDFLLRLIAALGFAPEGNKAADSWVIPYAEHHLNRRVPDIAKFTEKLYN